MRLVAHIAGKKVGLILDIKNGIISGTFDKNMNNKFNNSKIFVPNLMNKL